MSFLTKFKFPAIAIIIVGLMERCLAFAPVILNMRLMGDVFYLDYVLVFLMVFVVPIMEEYMRNWSVQKSGSIGSSYIYSILLIGLEYWQLSIVGLNFAVGTIIKSLLHFSINEVWRLKGVKWSATYHIVNNALFPVLLKGFSRIFGHSELRFYIFMTIAGMFYLSVIILIVKRRMNVNEHE